MFYYKHKKEVSVYRYGRTDDKWVHSCPTCGIRFFSDTAKKP